MIFFSVVGEDDYVYDYNYDHTYDDNVVYKEENKPSFISEAADFTAKLGDIVTFPCNVEKSKWETLVSSGTCRGIILQMHKVIDR